MTTVCLTVISIIGVFCFDNAMPIGDCRSSVHPHVTECTARADDLSIFVSAYDPVYCKPEIVGLDYEPTNCYGDPDYTGSGAYVPDWYYHGVSCPIGWNWRLLSIADVGEFRCIDSGTGIKPGYKLATRWNLANGVYLPVTQYEWTITVDILYPVYELGWPNYALQVYDHWSIE